MNIFDFSKEVDKNTLHELFLKHLKRQDIVPFFGAGFTCGYPAIDGTVPSVEDLRKELTDIIVEIENYSIEDRTELDDMKLSELADSFWFSLNQSKTPQKYRDQFNTYVENHFCGVHDFPAEYYGLINCRWRYLYTLNYDDTIENIFPGIMVVTPYSNQNRQWLTKKRCLYKIHGDSKKFLETGESKYFILRAYPKITDEPESAYARQ